ncbi:hypothetical protein [Azospirillum canadense]|uniref:hypothetical protein n=1 Tax=Azospirillum canadense TaxID=403962 RepID=UPI00222739A2|nr:hypothetical protein [Azospirillum canadense]MCW2236942.1 hypothetical protein [Azospirillum canadense]
MARDPRALSPDRIMTIHPHRRDGNGAVYGWSHHAKTIVFPENHTHWYSVQSTSIPLVDAAQATTVDA